MITSTQAVKGQRRGHHRLLIYSHDSFGLGHLRRCRTIAHAIVDHRPDVTVLIVSGSPIIGSFGFAPRVDFVRVPGVIKLHDGDYQPLSLDVSVDTLMEMRAKIICRTAEAFEPDLFIVDKEPLGLRGELRDTLTMLKAHGVPRVLGLRDIMDDPDQLAEEWRRKNAAQALHDLYDRIWIYGLPEICNPLDGIPMSPETQAKIRYTGYLRRSPTAEHSRAIKDEEPYLLVTTGGGGDGATLIDGVLAAYEHDPGLPHRALLVLGPFMRSALQIEFMERVERLSRVEAITFEANLEDLMASAAGVVAMGGYNTFCEILSFDKPSLIVPRRSPRLEQFIRASRADALGLARIVPPGCERDPKRMAALLRALPDQPPPSTVSIAGLLDGLSVIRGYIDDCFAVPSASKPRLSVVT